MDPTRVLLLKTKSTPHDGYEELFVASEHYDPVFVPVLEHHFNEEALSQIERLITSAAFDPERSPDGATPSYGGMIFTSQRAIEAFTMIIGRIRAVGTHHLGHLLPAITPLYVVGPATARGLRAIGLQCEIAGEETGNGEALAAFILEHHHRLLQATSRPKSPLLFLVGEQRRDIIPKTLQAPGLGRDQIPVTETTVYETGVMKNFPSMFKEAIGTAISHSRVQWIVVFSPTGCKAMLDGLGLLDEKTGKAIPKAAGRKTFVATIGPTTRDYLQREFSFEPDVCSVKPTPEGVADGIAAFEKSQAI